MSSTEDLKRFGSIVKDRRAALGMTQLEVWQSGGPSNTTLTKIENAEGAPPSGLTLRKLDHALRWSPGSAKRALEGGEPLDREEDPAYLRDRNSMAAEMARGEERLIREARGTEVSMGNVVDDVILISNAAHSIVGAAAAAMRLEVPKQEVRALINGMRDVLIGSGAFPVLFRADRAATLGLLEALGEQDSLNEDRPDSTGESLPSTGAAEPAPSREPRDHAEGSE